MCVLMMLSRDEIFSAALVWTCDWRVAGNSLSGRGILKGCWLVFVPILAVEAWGAAEHGIRLGRWHLVEEAKIRLSRIRGTC